MRNHNSQNSSFYAATLVSVYHDMVCAILPHDEIERDSAEMLRRSSNEGMSFLTKTLPSLGKSIDVSLANGTALNVSHFQRKVGTNLPRFMYDAFKMVFRDDGVPWFATWYSDVRISLMGGADMDQSTRDWTDNDMVTIGPDRLRGVIPLDHYELTGDEVFSWIPCKRFPGMHRLNKGSFSVEERLAISLGLHKSYQPLMGNHELSSRREAMAVALRALRQVCFCFYKLNIPYSDEQETRTLADFVSVDEQLDFEVKRLDPEIGSIHKRARQIICRVLANADPLSGIPRHGPGAVATGEKLPEKHVFKRFYSRLNDVFKYDEWFFCNLSHVCDSVEELQAFASHEAGTAKVVLVPKDSRGPRLISCEPLEYQWIQQSLMGILVDTLEKHPLTKGLVNFTDQEVNRRLALESSIDYSTVTLDMKEASDRVSMELVKTLFPDSWWSCLYASRSSATQLPDGRIIHLKKFAPMGSAVCFPVEALVFWALSVATLLVKHNLPLRKAVTKVYVYGDDIICDADYHGDIINTLPKFGLLLNDNKCCVAGSFKESCGMDAYLGIPVTPTKIRSTWCYYPEPSMLASYVEYSNTFYRSGMFKSAFHLEEAIQRVLKHAKMSPIPTVSGGNPSCLAFVRTHERPILKNRANGLKIRFNSDLHKHEVRGYRLESKSEVTKTFGWPFLLRILTQLEAKNRHHSTSDVTNGACSLATGQYPSAFRVKLKKAWTFMA